MITAKVRADSFASRLDPTQAWALYDYHYQTALGKWDLSAAWAEKQFELAKKPSRAAFYEWLKKMNALYGAHIREIRSLCDERIEEGAKLLKVQDPTVIRSIKAEALDAGLVEKDWEKAKMIMDLAHGIEDAAFKQAEIDLRGRAQDTKDEQLKLAREKFEAAERRLAAVQDAVKAAKTGGGLTEETLKKIEEAAGLL